MPSVLRKNLLVSTVQIKIGSVSVHRFSVFPGIKDVMTQRKNSTKNERCYGRDEKFPLLITRRLHLGKSIAEVDLPMPERSHLGPLVLLV